MITIFILTLLLAIFLGFWLSQKTKPVKTEPQPDKIIVYKTAKELHLFINGNHYRYPIATGKNTGDKQKVGDNRTPLGPFSIVSVENSSAWSYDFGDGLGPIVGAYGPWFIRLQGLNEKNKYWQGIGIHGTHDESTIGKDDTHGCVRMKNRDVEELKNLVYQGISVDILE